jgi:hypothetical protein
VFLFFTKDLGVSNLFCGLSVAVTVSLEVPIYFFSDKLMNRFNNHHLLTFSCLAYMFRVVWSLSLSLAPISK